MDNQTRFAQARKVTWVGTIINIILSGLKLVVGIVGHSEALVADAAHSASDFVTDIALLIGLKVSARPVDETHPYGHGRVETVVSFLMGLALGGVAIGIGWKAVKIIYTREVYHPEVVTVVMAFISVVAKELLYRYTIREGKRIGSPSVVANAWEHRSDAFASLITMLGIGTAIIKPEWFLVEPLVAFGVALLILRISWSITWEAVSELVDTAAQRETRRAIESAAREVTGVSDVHDLKTRHIGRNVLADLHIEVSPRLSVTDSHHISSRVQEAIQQRVGNVAEVQVHVEPEGERLRQNQKIPVIPDDVVEEQIKQLAYSIERILGLHGLKIRRRGQDLQVDIDIEVDPQMLVSESHALAKKLRHKIMQIDNIKEVMVHVDIYKGDKA